MSFSPHWLALRRTADDRARSTDLTAELTKVLAGRREVRILDLGCGTGANMVALAPHIPAVQTWVLADNDPELLTRIRPPTGVSVQPHCVDLAADLARLFDPTPDLVTASAFFDLCGADLADRIVRQTIAAGAVFHTALSYDGREIWEPADPLDASVLDAFLRDQRRDKGLGPALGPEATAYLAQAFGAAGYAVSLGDSDWDLRPPEDQAMIAALANGHADTVRHDLGALAGDWLAARSGTTRVVIGHQDLLAVPPG